MSATWIDELAAKIVRHGGYFVRYSGNSHPIYRLGKTMITLPSNSGRDHGGLTHPRSYFEGPIDRAIKAQGLKPRIVRDAPPAPGVTPEDLHVPATLDPTNGVLPVVEAPGVLPIVEAPAPPAEAPKEEAPMAKKTRKPLTFVKCPVPGCGGKAHGKHTAMHRRKGDWKPEFNANLIRGGKKSRATARAAALSSPDGHGPVATRVTDLSALDAAFKVMREVVDGLRVERDVYHRELNDARRELSEAREGWDRLRTAFGASPAAPSRVRRKL